MKIWNLFYLKFIISLAVNQSKSLSSFNKYISGMFNYYDYLIVNITFPCHHSILVPGLPTLSPSPSRLICPFPPSWENSNLTPSREAGFIILSVCSYSVYTHSFSHIHMPPQRRWSYCGLTSSVAYIPWWQELDWHSTVPGAMLDMWYKWHKCLLPE